MHLLSGIPQINRGVALGGGNTYVLTADDQIVALRQSNGHVVFNVTVGNEASGVFESMAPLYANGNLCPKVSAPRHNFAIYNHYR
ncbi:hypothetical protein [Alicyclobacillus sp. ALC3]|uniref:hypothetical protein n=1 Tax=Alicyclobacillus sp. ALC3 TaxID=2796143 RepID=UPI002378D2BD|nr:hypothetical protein [Alicyclobacillus sp. ALC3]WDL99068.1 hypothetical protein JC200_10685 [Alicyclobacillus sp. ALC3]